MRIEFERYFLEGVKTKYNGSPDFDYNEERFEFFIDFVLGKLEELEKEVKKTIP